MREGFQKIQLFSQYKKSSPGKLPRKLKPAEIGLILAGFFLVLIFFVVTVALPAKEIFTTAKQTQSIGNKTYQAAKNQDIDATSSSLNELENNLTTLQSQLGRLAWIGVIPFIGNYGKDAISGVNAALATVQAAKIAANTLTPYSDLL